MPLCQRLVLTPGVHAHVYRNNTKLSSRLYVYHVSQIFAGSWSITQLWCTSASHRYFGVTTVTTDSNQA
jgi:hypothetical protein